MPNIFKVNVVMDYDQESIDNISIGRIEENHKENSIYTGRYNATRVTPISHSRQHRI